ncbi:penicillin acylase family protein [Actinacidiphila bryophytorum]|uniref:penicillin acylase family protein n=1 Tax=Actinacidiphila bryophytorum TaxID=1436133 RepID=UPI002176C99A|nr:penicillin acylase family protein [Actinacidiphila bryophytorum]UWE08044.1 penicillin acylase family protein [Actinacidiphila bryophytorum]
MPARKKSRRVRYVVITIVLLLVAGAGFGSYWSVSTVRASFPQTSGSLKLAGLSAPVDVKRDAYGIPQIYADTPRDLFRAQGYVQAQDRFYEMDVRRHLTSGRLSEMFGKGQVETDAFLRTLNWHGIAQEEYNTKLDATTKQYLQAYSDGVNAYLKDHSGAGLSVEYAALKFSNNYRPEPWTPVDSVAWLKAMAWDLRGNMQDEIDRALMTSRLSQAQIKQLYPAYPYDRNRPIVDAGSVDPVTGNYTPANSSGPQGLSSSVDSQLAGISQIVDQMPAMLGPSGSGIGSNSWVVSGAYTTTGEPLLANDPHLAPQLPSLWYQMGLHCRTVNSACPYDVAGYTFSGMPGVVIGHNQAIAWGMTNLGADVTDLYLEKVTASTYLYDGKQKPFTTRKEIIKVAGGKDRVITVRGTNNGPLISDRSDEIRTVGQTAPVTDAPGGVNAGYAVALRWTALTPSKTMDAVFELDRATDFDHFRAAAADFAVPSQNLIYADTKGNIGYQAPGQVPIRPDGDDGTYPVPGWDSHYNWGKNIPFKSMPYEYNPSRGYIVTANQAVIDQSKYNFMLTQDWGYGTRSQRINNLIASKIKDGGKVSMDDMQAMQGDDFSEIAQQLVPYLLKVDITDDKNSYVRKAQKLLEGWDYNQDADSAAAAYFNAVWRNVLKLAFGNKLPKELRPEGQCLRVPPVGQTGPVDNLDGKGVVTVQECGERDADEAQPDGGDRWFEVMRNILPDANNAWWTMSTTAFFGTDTNKAHHSTRDQLLEQAMKDARYELTADLGKDIDTWSWGRLHKLDLKNQTLGTDGPGVVKWLLNRGPWQLSGGEAAVDATGWNAAGGYDVVWVPSMRMIVNLKDLDKSRWINLTGASGHAYNAHYTDQTDKWANNELLPWYFSDDRVDAEAKAKMALTP